MVSFGIGYRRPMTAYNEKPETTKGKPKLYSGLGKTLTIVGGLMASVGIGGAFYNAAPEILENFSRANPQITQKYLPPKIVQEYEFAEETLKILNIKKNNLTNRLNLSYNNLAIQELEELIAQQTLEQLPALEESISSVQKDIFKISQNEDFINYQENERRKDKQNPWFALLTIGGFGLMGLPKVIRTIQGKKRF